MRNEEKKIIMAKRKIKEYFYSLLDEMGERGEIKISIKSPTLEESNITITLINNDELFFRERKACIWMKSTGTYNINEEWADNYFNSFDLKIIDFVAKNREKIDKLFNEELNKLIEQEKQEINKISESLETVLNW